MRSLFLTASAAALALVAGAKSSDKVNWQNVTGTSSTAFPTAVGNLGDMLYAAPPFVAQENRVNSTSIPNTAIEMRWKPKDADKDNATSADIFRNLGAQSPYHPADDLFPETNAYQNVPEQCKIEQVHILQRHGARYPTSSEVEAAPIFGKAVKNATKAKKFKATGELEFLNSWNYSLGSQVLVHQGAKENFDAGVQAYYNYAHLLSNYSKKLVLRTTSQSRMLDTARYWMLGFFGWDASDKAHLAVLAENEKQNTTLASYYDCPNSDNTSYAFGNKMSREWEKVYLKDATARLQKDIQGVKLTPYLVYGMMQLCAYETVGMGYSNFCPLFTKQEWEHFEYDTDLQYQGQYGFMNPSGRAQGMGWATEFLDRLTNKTFSGSLTSQNSTIDKNSTYFPLKQPLYVDFTHDNIIHSALVAMNYTQFADFLPVDKPDPKRRYRASRLTPFAARLVYEVMECKEGGKTDKYIRTKINQALIPMDKDQGCEKRKDGLCKLQDFTQHQLKHAFKDANFKAACFGKNGTDFIVTGPVHNGTVASLKH